MKLEELKQKRIGLVLSGGGAKGAYQVGVFRVLEELGLAEHLTAMSGCSIGAFAEVIYTRKGWEEYRAFLHQFPELIADGSVLSPEKIAEAREAVASGSVGKEEFWTERRFWQFEAKGFQSYFETLLKEYPIEKDGIPLTTCCYSIEKERPEYFLLQEMSVEEQLNAIIGSGSLPFVFAPRVIGDSHYLDGGAIPSICRNPAPHDKIPLRPILKENVDVILVSYLMPKDQVDLSLVPEGVEVIELRPSVPLEERPGSGTSDFSTRSLLWREQLGYDDTRKVFANLE